MTKTLEHSNNQKSEFNFRNKLTSVEFVYYKLNLVLRVFKIQYYYCLLFILVDQKNSLLIKKRERVRDVVKWMDNIF